MQRHLAFDHNSSHSSRVLHSPRKNVGSTAEYPPHIVCVRVQRNTLITRQCGQSAAWTKSSSIRDAASHFNQRACSVLHIQTDVRIQSTGLNPRSPTNSHHPPRLTNLKPAAHTTIQAYGVVRLELQPVQRSAWKKTPPPSSNVPLSHITDSRKTTSRDQEVEGRLRRIATSASGDSEDTTASDQHLTAPRIGLQPTVPTRIQRHAPRTANCDQQCECGPKRRHAQCSSWRRTRT